MVDIHFAPLPRNRIHCTAAFEVVGVDMAGSFYLKDGTKYWIVLFTCAVYRAVHLELSKALSMKSFILSLKICCQKTNFYSYSNNGTNFVGTNNLMKNFEFFIC